MHKKTGRILLLFCLSVALEACTAVPGVYMPGTSSATPVKEGNTLVYPQFIPVTGKVLRSQKPYQYHIGRYDTLSIIVWGHPELSQPKEITNAQGATVSNAVNIVVDHYGYIYFPFAGRVKVAGLNVEQIREKLTSKLASYIRNPRITVEVSGYYNKEVSVVGAIRKPGTQPLTNKPLSLMDAINAAQGIDTDADTSHVYVIRAVAARRTKLPKPNIQYGSAPMARADVFWLSMNSPQSMLYAEKFYLHPNDVVYVSSAPIADWNRVVNLVMPSLQTALDVRELTR